MSEDKSRKTQKPTPKRIRDFRKKGEIAVSKDVAQTATMLGGACGVALFASQAGTALAGLARVSFLAADGTPDVSLPQAATRAFVTCCAPAAVGALLGYLVATAAQLGWPPAFKKPKFELGKLFSAQKIGQIISPKAASGRVLKATAKVVFVGLAVVLAMRAEFDQFMHDPALEPASLAARLGDAVVELCGFALLALAAISAVDYFVSRRRIWNKMKMTPEELKREHKQQEGDPHVKAQRKRKMRELAQRRLAAEVKTADVVLVNPTEYAVALRYCAGSESAPRVVAKGRGPVAGRIRELARKAGIPILRRPPLTRLIHKLVREGREIPGELYQVVAEILAYVYRLRGRGM